jgi:hypothetical protein
MGVGDKQQEHYQPAVQLNGSQAEPSRQGERTQVARLTLFNV